MSKRVRLENHRLRSMIEKTITDSRDVLEALDHARRMETTATARALRGAERELYQTEHTL